MEIFLVFLLINSLQSAEILSANFADNSTVCIKVNDGTAVHMTRKEKAQGKFGYIKGDSINKQAVSEKRNYIIKSKNDKTYSRGLHPIKVSYKAKGTEFVNAGKWKFIPRMTYWIYLELPEKPSRNKNYEIEVSSSVSGKNKLTAEFTSDWKKTISESIHVSLAGFPVESPKYAYISSWSGTGGGLNMQGFDGKKFYIYKASSTLSKPVFSANIKIRRTAEETGDDHYKQNFQKSDLCEMDFSSFKNEGEYFISIPGLGRSRTFKISKNAFSKAYKITTRGLYYLRCGIKLEKKYAGKWARKRCHHPDDGKKIQETTLPLSKTKMGAGNLNQFSELPKSTTGKTLDYWGGWHDAGDWDRRAQHLRGASKLLNVYCFNPNSFKDRELHIPESGNGIPDIVDEALWCVDFFRRGQTADGGVRGGIESNNHPKYNSNSWDDPLPLFAYKQDLWSSLFFARTAAQAYRALKIAGKHSKAAEYLKAAEKAWNWCEKNDNGKFRDEKNAAAATLYSVTGKNKYHKAFKETCIWVKNPNAAPYEYKKHEQRNAGFTYVYFVTERKKDKKLAETIKKSLLKEGDTALNDTEKRAFRFGGSRWRPMNWGLGTSPDVLPMIYAYQLTQKKKYINAVAETCEFTLGGNPLNKVWVSGLHSEKSVKQILHHDSWYLSDINKWHNSVPGLVPAGPTSFRKFSKRIHGFTQKSFSPHPKQWPVLELFAGNRYDPGSNEITAEIIANAASVYAFVYSVYNSKLNK